MKIKENVIATLGKSRHGIKPLKFSDIYDYVEECVNELKQISEENILKNLKGQDFLLGFKRALNSNKELSGKQTVQLKRLANEIARGYYLEHTKYKK